MVNSPSECPRPPTGTRISSSVPPLALAKIRSRAARRRPSFERHAEGRAVGGREDVALDLGSAIERGHRNVPDSAARRGRDRRAGCAAGCCRSRSARRARGSATARPATPSTAEFASVAQVDRAARNGDRHRQPGPRPVITTGASSQPPRRTRSNVASPRPAALGGWSRARPRQGPGRRWRARSRPAGQARAVPRSRACRPSARLAPAGAGQPDFHAEPAEIGGQRQAAARRPAPRGRCRTAPRVLPETIASRPRPSPASVAG